MSRVRNPGVPFDESWFVNVEINLPAVTRRVEQIITRRTVKNQWQAAWLLRAVTCLDLSALSGDTTDSSIQRMCFKAKNPIMYDLLKAMDMHEKGLTAAAICVYPARVADFVKHLNQCGAGHIPIASAATGFPAGQTHLNTRLEEIRQAVADGAREIDVVINRSYVLGGNWKGVYDEIRQMKEASGSCLLKVILATGELGSLANVYRASMVTMMAGGDFIKTSTGKERVNATLVVGLVMMRAIREYNHRTGVKVGVKPAGGIKTAKEALYWLYMVKEELGNEYTNRDLFRIGASGLIGDIERQLYHYVHGRYAATHELPMS